MALVVCGFALTMTMIWMPAAGTAVPLPVGSAADQSRLDGRSGDDTHHEVRAVLPSPAGEGSQRRSRYAAAAEYNTPTGFVDLLPFGPVLQLDGTAADPAPSTASTPREPASIETAVRTEEGDGPAVENGTGEFQPSPADSPVVVGDIDACGEESKRLSAPNSAATSDQADEKSDEPGDAKNTPPFVERPAGTCE